MDKEKDIIHDSKVEINDVTLDEDVRRAIEQKEAIAATDASVLNRVMAGAWTL